MNYVPVKEAKNRLSEVLRKVEAGETVMITRDGVPVADVTAHKPVPTGGIDFERGRAYLRSIGIDNYVTYIAPDFDDPLPEDFLTTPERD
jgi:prevent-host-death family protein